MMKPMLFSPLVFEGMKLPLRRGFRDGHDQSGDARAHHGKGDLGVSQDPEGDAGQLAERLRSEGQSRREEPSPAKRPRPPEGRADPRGDAERDQTEDHDRGRHQVSDGSAEASIGARARTELDRLPRYDAAPDDLVAVVEDGSLTRRHERGGFEVERRVVTVHVDVSGKWDAAVPQNDVRREVR